MALKCKENYECISSLGIEMTIVSQRQPADEISNLQYHAADILADQGDAKQILVHRVG